MVVGISRKSLCLKRAQGKETSSFTLTFFDKKGQMKIQQMAFMLMAVFILFILIGIVFISVRVSNLNEIATEYQRENALTLASKLSNSPEFSCGNSYGTQKSNCVDLDKLMGLKENVNNYEGFWEVSNIEVRIVYPEPEEGIKCTQSNYPDCNWFDLKEGGLAGYSVSNFVSVCHKEQNGNVVSDVCEIGELIISYEEVK